MFTHHSLPIHINFSLEQRLQSGRPNNIPFVCHAEEEGKSRKEENGDEMNLLSTEFEEEEEEYVCCINQHKEREKRKVSFFLRQANLPEFFETKNFFISVFAF